MPVPPAESATFGELNEAFRALEEDDAVRATVPVKPPRLARLIVEVPVEPKVKLTVAGLAVML